MPRTPLACPGPEPLPTHAVAWTPGCDADTTWQPLSSAASATTAAHALQAPPNHAAAAFRWRLLDLNSTPKGRPS